MSEGSDAGQPRSPRNPPAADPTEAIEQGPPCLGCGSLETIVLSGLGGPDIIFCPQCKAERFLPRPPSQRRGRA